MGSISPWIMLAIGIIIGWLLAWLFGRSGQQSLAQRVEDLQADLQRANGNLEECRAQATTLRADLGRCEAQLAEANNTIAELPRETIAAPDFAATRAGAVIDLGAPVHVDDFTQIKGIGPAYAARLAEAGITTYADLSAIGPEDLANVVDVREWQNVDTAAWIAAAQTLADRPARVQVGDDLLRIEGIGPTYATRLRAANITTFAQLADSDEETLAQIIGAPAWRKVAYADWIAQAQLAAAGDEAGLQALQDRLNRRTGNKLGLIAGLGPQSIQVLENAGITGYADLAAADPERLRTLFSAAGVRGGNFAGWIEEAKLRDAGKRVPRMATRTRAIPLGTVQQRSCPQDLEEIAGIGRVYEQRLYAVGIGTYWEVGMLPLEDLNQILDVQEFQDVDLAAIQANALRLAEATDTMGHTWDGTEPDDFEAIEGIGPVLERRLYAAGICTYEALAEATEDLLERVAQAPTFQQPNYEAWITQARARLAD